jgi:hypothetical protein
VLVDNSKSNPNTNKPSNDSPVYLKLTPKAQWPLQRFISSDESKFPLNSDNPLLTAGFSSQNSKKSNNHQQQQKQQQVLTHQVDASGSLLSMNTNNNDNTNFNDWIKLIEVNTHLGPHRRLFMGPQFVFKTFNSSITTTMLNPASSSLICDTQTEHQQTPIIDLSDDIELNTLDINTNNNFANQAHLRKFPANHHLYSAPMQINSAALSGGSRSGASSSQCTPTYIEVGAAGSYQEGMPILCSSIGSRGSQKFLNSNCMINKNNNQVADLLGENLIESIADAMNEVVMPTSSNPVTQSSSNTKIYPNKSSTKWSSSSTNKQQPIPINRIDGSSLLLMNAMPSTTTMNTEGVAVGSVGSSSNGSVPAAVGSYFMVNPTLYSPNINTSLSRNNSSNSSSSSSSSTSSSSSSGSSSSSASSNVSSLNDDEPPTSALNRLNLDRKASSGSSSTSKTTNTTMTSNREPLFGLRSLEFNTGLGGMGSSNSSSGLDHLQFQDDSLLN